MMKRYCSIIKVSKKIMIFSFFPIYTSTKSKKKDQKILQKNFKIANSIRYKSQVKNKIRSPFLRLKTGFSGKF